MTMTEIEARKAEIKLEMDADGANIDALLEEVRQLNTEAEEIRAKAEKEAELRAAVASGEVGVIVTKLNEQVNPVLEERKMFDVSSREYRDAFYAYVSGKELTAEQRDALLNVDGNTAGSISASAIALPTALDEMIWDNIHHAHPILADINTVNSGVVMMVTKHTAIATRASGKKDADTTVAAEDNTFVKITLAGVDYAKYVELTYAEAMMTQGALEAYIATEIAAELGAALATDVFARIKSDATSGQAVSKSTNGWFETLATALGKADMAVNPVIYCTNAVYYDIFGTVDDNGQPIFRDGVAIGATVKIDSAAGGYPVIVDPAMFLLNVVQPTMIESDKDVKAHHVIVSGYLRAEGTLRKNKAASYVTA